MIAARLSSASPLRQPRPCLPVLLVSLLFFGSVALGQTKELRFEGIPLGHGSTGYRSFSVSQDSTGFIWIASADGLYRFDGESYTAFRPQPNDSTGIPSTIIWSLTTGRDGILWIGTFDGGLVSFDPNTEAFTRYRNRSEDPASISRGPVTTLFEDHTGALWVGTEISGLNLLHRGSARFTHFTHVAGELLSLPSNSIRAICEDSSGTLWVGTESGLCTLDRESGTFRPFRIRPGDLGNLGKDAISSLCFDGAGILWVGTLQRGVERLDLRTGKAVRYRRLTGDPRSLSSDSVTSIYQSDPPFLWVGTQNGLNRFDTRTGQCERYYHDPLDPNSLTNNCVRQITGDRTGTIWIASDNNVLKGRQHGGVCKIMSKSLQFVHLQLSSDDGEPLGIVALYREPAAGDLWLGTGEGLRKLREGGTKVSVYRHVPGDRRSLSSDVVSAILVDRSGTMWVGTWDGVNRFDRATGKSVSYRWNPPASTKGNSVLSLSEASARSSSPGDTAMALWIGTFRDGLLRFSPSTGTFTHWLHESGDPGSLVTDRVSTTYADRAGLLWIGTDGGGLDQYDPDANSFIHHVHDPANPKALANNTIAAICEDDSSYIGRGAILWLGTDAGLERFDAAEGTVTHHLFPPSSSPVKIRAIVSVRGSLWMSTAQSGIFRFVPRTEQWSNFSAESGVHSNVFWRGVCTSPSGDIIFSSEGGIDLFSPDSIRENPVPPPVVITSFDLFDKPFDPGRPFWTRPVIHLNYDQDFFSFRFAALDYTGPGRNQFAYKLEGFDKSWNFPGARNFAGYTKVDPGEYVFRVKAANSDGIWNTAGASVNLIIDPPYWGTWWFRILVGVVVIALLAGAYNYRVSKLLEMQKMRLRIASDLHDDIGSSLSGIALITESVKAGLPAMAQDRERLAAATEAARKTADSLKDIVWIVNPEHDKMQDIMLRMKDIAAKFLAGREYTLDCGEHSVASTLDMEFRRHLILMYKEILNNIVKHSEAKKVSICIAQREKEFLLTIRDDGSGFDVDTVRRGNGLNNLQRRAAQVGGTVQIRSKPGEGTSVEFRAPIR